MRAGPVIVNSTPLIAFWSISRLDILQKLFSEILIPPAVREEFLLAGNDARGKTLEVEEWIHVVALSNPNKARAFTGLHQGEAEVLALADEQSAALILVDERKARRYAQRMKLPLSGTLGVLLLAKEENIIPAVEPLLEAIQKAGLYLHAELVTQVLHLAGEK